MEIKEKIEELLKEWHPAEIGRLVGLDDLEAKKIIRQIYFEWGYTEPQDYKVEFIGDKNYVIFLNQGDEFIDHDGFFRFFDSEESAISHLHSSLRIYHDETLLNTYS
jgi:hypothetical protein